MDANLFYRGPMKIQTILLTLTLSLTPLFALANTCDGMTITVENATSNHDIYLDSYSASTGALEGLTNQIKIYPGGSIYLQATDHHGHTPKGYIYYTLDSGTQQYALHYDAKSSESECKPDKKSQGDTSQNITIKIHTQNGVGSAAIERFKVEKGTGGVPAM